MQQEIGVSEESTKRYRESAQQAGFMCSCHIHPTGNSSNYEYGGKRAKKSGCKVAAFKGKTQFYLIKNSTLGLDVSLRESSPFPPRSRPPWTLTPPCTVAIFIHHHPLSAMFVFPLSAPGTGNQKLSEGGGGAASFPRSRRN